MTDALDAVIDTAIERALLADDARRYFALAGALERGRLAARTDGAGPQQQECRDPDPERSKFATHALGAALITTAAVGALESGDTDGIDSSAWSPGDRDGGRNTELIAAGAAAACRRFDVELGTVAARSGLSRERLARYRVDGDVTTGSK